MPEHQIRNGTNKEIANGEVSLVLQDESYNVNLAISYHNGKLAKDRKSTQKLILRVQILPPTMYS